jgi:chemotaxis protein MotB
MRQRSDKEPGIKTSGDRTMLIRLTTATLVPLTVLLLSACVPPQQYDALENDYNQLEQQLSGQIAQQQVHITRLQGAIKVAVNSDLLFPSGGWQMPQAAAQTIAEMAPILAPFQQTTIIVTGYTDNVPIGPELQQQGVSSNQQLSLMRAQTVANFLISQGVKPNLVQTRGLGDTDPVASNDTPGGRAQNRRVELTLAGPGN